MANSKPHHVWTPRLYTKSYDGRKRTCDHCGLMCQKEKVPVHIYGADVSHLRIPMKRTRMYIWRIKHPTENKWHYVWDMPACISKDD